MLDIEMLHRFINGERLFLDGEKWEFVGGKCKSNKSTFHLEYVIERYERDWQMNPETLKIQELSIGDQFTFTNGGGSPAYTIVKLSSEHGFGWIHGNSVTVYNPTIHKNLEVELI